MAYTFVEHSVPLYYETVGSGTPIVFVHPPGMGSVTFHRQQRELSSSFQVVTYDLRGNGKSGKGNKPITMDMLASDLHELFNHLQIKEAIVCGYSNGGSIAQHFALQYPHQVKALILIGGFRKCVPRYCMGNFHGHLCGQMARTIFLANVLGRSHGITKEEQQMIADYVRLSDRKRLYEMYVSGLHYRSTDRLHELRCPLLLIYGARDYYVHAYGRIFQQHAPDVRIVYVDGARHQIPTNMMLNSI